MRARGVGRLARGRSLNSEQGKFGSHRPPLQVLSDGHQSFAALKADVSLQVHDFSPVITIFHVFSRIFHPISQPQEFDFSPVAKKTRFN
jgi:hypothetical protein